MRRVYTKIGLGLVGLVFVFAVVSFLRENWGADVQPGPMETFLAQWVLSRARQPETQMANPHSPTEENLREGQLHYEKQCAFCHGQDGSGQRMNGVQFYPPAPSLVESAPEMSDGQMHAIISRGFRYTAMPSFAKALTSDQIWKVILWVRQLPAQPAAGPQKPLVQEENRSP